MTIDDDQNDGGPRRLFSTLPTRPPIREVQRPTAEQAAATAASDAVEGATLDTIEEMRLMILQDHQKAIAMRSAARQDAMIVVARARERRGDKGPNWSAYDADAAHLIADLLMKLQGQRPAPLDDAFSKRDEDLAAAAKATSKIEEAIKRDDDPPPSSA